MKNQKKTASAAHAEAANIDTPLERLDELALLPALMAIVAANPAAPGETLGKLIAQKDPAVRQALAGNPNTPVRFLLQLASEFPFEFLSNPVLPLLNLSQPDFIKSLPQQGWVQLLRYDLVPSVWLKWIQQGIIMPSPWQRKEIVSELSFHVTITGEATSGWEKKAKKALQEDAHLFGYLHRANSTIFLLSILAFPGLAEQWGAELRGVQKELQALALAHTPTLSGHVLALLARDAEISIRCATARHPRTPAKVLIKLVEKSTEAAARRAVASNPHLPEKLLKRLAGDDDATVRLAVAHHPQLTLELLETLTLDAEPAVRAAVARHPRLNLYISHFLEDDAAPSVRAALARNVHAPLETLLALARDAALEVRVALARNPRLPAEVFALLFQDENAHVRASLASNPRLPLPLLEQLAANPQPNMRLSLAANPRTPVHTLEAWLAEETSREGQGNKAFLLALARHPRATPAMLTALAGYHSGRAESLAGVRAAVAAHSRTPVEVLRKLAIQTMLSIKRSLAANPHTPLDVLKQLLATDDKELWIRIAHHPAVIADQRRILIDLLLEKTRNNRASELPAWFVFQQKELPEDTFKALLTSQFWRDRYLVARHPKASYDILAALTRDGNRFVRVAARTTLIKRNKLTKRMQTKRDV